MTLGIDIGVIKIIITHAAAVHGLDISSEPIVLARVALKRLGLIGKGTERDRRPSKDELIRLFRCFDENERLTIPMTRVVHFAVATAMRLEEICRVEWTDLDVDRRMLLIRDRKDPRNKNGNDQRIPLFAATGFDAWALVSTQAKDPGHTKGRIFPLQFEIGRNRLPVRLRAGRREEPASSRLAPRRHKPPVLGRLRHRTNCPGHRPQGLEDAAPLYPYPARSSAPAGRVACALPVWEPRCRVIRESEGSCPSLRRVWRCGAGRAKLMRRTKMPSPRRSPNPGRAVRSKAKSTDSSSSSARYTVEPISTC